MREVTRYEIATKTTIKPTNNSMKLVKVPFLSELSFVSIFLILINILFK